MKRFVEVVQRTHIDACDASGGMRLRTLVIKFDPGRETLAYLPEQRGSLKSGIDPVPSRIDAITAASESGPWSEGFLSPDRKEFVRLVVAKIAGRNSAVDRRIKADLWTPALFVLTHKSVFDSELGIGNSESRTASVRRAESYGKRNAHLDVR